MTSLTFRAMSNKKMVAIVIFNRAFLKTQIKPGMTVTVFGKYDALKNTVIASDIKFEKLVTGSVESVYHLTSGLTSKALKKYIAEALVNYDNYIDYILCCVFWFFDFSARWSLEIYFRYILRRNRIKNN